MRFSSSPAFTTQTHSRGQGKIIPEQMHGQVDSIHITRQ
ncbi:hypothetical protein CaCOL14_001598 [Colletotrichum acutatum]